MDSTENLVDPNGPGQTHEQSESSDNSHHDSHALVAQISKKSFFARLTMPLFIDNYAIKVCEHCILKSFRKRLSEDEHDSELHPLWKAPPMQATLNLASLFSLFHCRFRRAAPFLFRKLREEVYEINEEKYQLEFTKHLKPISGLGFSGSKFFYSANKDYIVKSVGRRFEYSFFYGQLLHPLAEYMENNHGTLLSEITDALYSFEYRLGAYLGTSPSHFIVMRNVLIGFDKGKGCQKWDLKPPNFFEPTRDLVPDQIKSEAAKSGLADELDEKIVLTKKQKDELMYFLERDTEFLMKMETIDYSLLLGRYPIALFPDGLPQPETFITGVRSGDGKWVYKMCVLDFFWNVTHLHPKIIQVAGMALPEQTVTTHPWRYREEFLQMMENYIEVVDEGSSR